MDYKLNLWLLLLIKVSVIYLTTEDTSKVILQGDKYYKSYTIQQFTVGEHRVIAPLTSIQAVSYYFGHSFVGKEIDTVIMIHMNE